MTNHAVGGYTSRAIGKRWNRRNEEIADMSERACVTAMVNNGYKYPQETLTKAWKRVIAHQFHDDLPGTSVQRAYRRSWNDYAMSLNQFTNEYEGAVKSIATNLDTSFVKGVAVVVEAEHLCMTMRGIKAAGSQTQTSAIRGTMRKDARTRAEVMTLLGIR